MKYEQIYITKKKEKKEPKFGLNIGIGCLDMISAILINAQNEPVQIVKQAANFFIADRAFDCATGSFTVSLKNRRENSRLQDVRVVHIFGDGINRTFKVDKSTMDNTRAFPKLNYDISGKRGNIISNLWT